VAFNSSIVERILDLLERQHHQHNWRPFPQQEFKALSLKNGLESLDLFLHGALKILRNHHPCG
jgi:hypothetical protein